MKKIGIYIHRTRDAGGFEEGKHPRAENGQFGKGSGGSKSPVVAAKEKRIAAAVNEGKNHRASQEMSRLSPEQKAEVAKHGTLANYKAVKRIEARRAERANKTGEKLNGSQSHNMGRFDKNWNSNVEYYGGGMSPEKAEQATAHAYGWENRNRELKGESKAKSPSDAHLGGLKKYYESGKSGAEKAHKEYGDADTGRDDHFQKNHGS